MITLEIFRSLFPNAKSHQLWVDALNKFLPLYDINSLKRVTTFLAQTGHESGGYTTLVENLNYSAQALANTWPNRFAVKISDKIKIPNEKANAIARKPEAIANSVYADRMGNCGETSGDGWRFRGKGLIQITGRENHEAFAKDCNLDILAICGYMLTIDGAVQSACWFWKRAGCNAFADNSDFQAQTKAINGGLIGYDDRKARLVTALKALDGSF